MPMLLILTVQLLAANDPVPDGPSPGESRGNVPITTSKDAWYLHVAPGHSGPVELRYVDKPDSVVLADTGEKLNFEYGAGMLKIEALKDSEAARVVVVNWPKSQWQKSMDAFAQQDRTQPPPANPIVFAGSSTIRMWNLQKYFPGLPTLNRGFGGSQYADLFRFADETILRYKPAMIVLYSGDNDIASGKSAEWITADAESVLARIRRDLPETPIVLVETKPSIARWNLYPEMQRANGLIEAVAKKYKNVQTIDPGPVLMDQDHKPDKSLFLADGLHLNDAGYEKVSALLRDRL